MDVMTIVTDRILADLEKGDIPWRKPWCSVTGAYNRVTERPYSLLNQLLLRHGGEYATFRQWTDAGGTIKRGAKSEIIVFWKWPALESDVDLANDENIEAGDNSGGISDSVDCKHDYPIHKKGPTLKYYRVFHISQVDGVVPKRTEPIFPSRPIVVAENLLTDYLQRENIRLETELTDTAFYSPDRDLIHIPSITQYPPDRVAGYYATAFHEAVHSTGHERRLARDGLKQVDFGSATYSREELVAEIGSACILQSLGISTEDTVTNTAAYVQGWLSALNRDKRMISFSAVQADKAVRLIFNNL